MKMKKQTKTQNIKKIFEHEEHNKNRRQFYKNKKHIKTEEH